MFSNGLMISLFSLSMYPVFVLPICLTLRITRALSTDIRNSVTLGLTMAKEPALEHLTYREMADRLLDTIFHSALP
jgi:hypothetical protein